MNGSLIMPRVMGGSLIMIHVMNGSLITPRVVSGSLIMIHVMNGSLIMPRVWTLLLAIRWCVQVKLL